MIEEPKMHKKCGKSNITSKPWKHCTSSIVLLYESLSSRWFWKKLNLLFRIKLNKVMRILRNLTSILLLMALMWPSVVKLNHHHDHLICKNQREVHFDSLHEKCTACEFEFSVFTSDPECVELSKPEHQDSYRDTYRRNSFSCDSQFFFSLRAPPFHLVWI